MMGSAECIALVHNLNSSCSHLAKHTRRGLQGLFCRLSITSCCRHRSQPAHADVSDRCSLRLLQPSTASSEQSGLMRIETSAQRTHIGRAQSQQ